MIIYKTTNLINGKIYIGQSINNDPKYLGSGVFLKNAIEKHGKENFLKEVIDVADSVGELNEKEIYWIEKYNSTDKNIGYNLCSGGKGLKIYSNKSEEEKEEIFNFLSNANKKAWNRKISNISDDDLKNLKKLKSEASKKGWQLTEEEYKERCKNISEGLINNNFDYSENTKKFWANLDDDRYDEIINKIRESNKRYWANLSDDKKKEISESKKEYWKNLSNVEKNGISESKREYWTNLMNNKTQKNYRDYLLSKMLDSSNEHRQKVKNALNKSENNEILSDEESKLVEKYYKFLDKVSDNSKKMWSEFSDEQLSKILEKKSKTMSEKYKNDIDFVNKRNKSLREVKCLRFVVKDLDTGIETEIISRKDLCEFIGITLHKYKKVFGSFETKLFNNFYIQKKQIN